MTHYEINHATGSSASVSFFGIPYADFDRTGHWAIWYVSKMFEAARILALYNGFIDFTKIDGREAALVIVKQQLKLIPKLHEKGMNVKFTMLFDLRLVEVGKTSVQFVVEFKDGNTREVYGENLIKMVRMSRKTRRPVTFPEWFYEKYDSYRNSYGSTQALPRDALPKIPDNAFKFDLIPRHSDSDRNNHVNQSSYIKFCMDAATHASLSGHYVHFNEDMCLYAPLLWTISYVGECRANDELSIYTWQSESSSPEHIEFSILLNDRLIFHASTIFEKEAKKVASSLSKI